MSNNQDDRLSDVDIEGIIQNMSISDLIGQMSMIDISLLLNANASISKDGDSMINQTALQYYIGTLGIGSVYSFIESSNNIEWDANTFRSISIQIQNVSQQYNRPPVLWGLDSIHGANFIHGAIVTPQPINIAATFNTTVAYMAGQLASRDTRAAGLQWIFAPLIGLALEPRWSRYYETFGEDPYLVGIMASNMIQGIQYYNHNQTDTNVNDTSSPSSIITYNGIPSRAAACAKHYLGYSKPNNGRDRSPSWIPTRHLYQYFVPPWKKVIQPNDNGMTGVLSIMESYSEVDGIPMVANTATLNTLLRHRLNFNGVALTDFQEIEHLLTWHHVAKNQTDTVAYTLSQGSIDMSMIPFNPEQYRNGVEYGVQSNTYTINRLRESVRRILSMKKELGMFDETIAMENRNVELIGTDEESVMGMVHQSIVLVKNEHNFLPLSRSYGTYNRQINVLITGPTANSRVYQSGGWTGHWEGAPNEDSFTYGSTVLNSFVRQPAYNVTYSCGTDIIGRNCDSALLSNDSSIDQAAEIAQDVDIVIICLGEENYAEKPGDLVDDDLHLPFGQYDLVQTIVSQTKKDTRVLLIYLGGRPRLLGSIVDLVDAIILGFLPGPSAGDAIANIVTGQVNPSGRLPITYPNTNTGTYPYYHTMSDQCTVGEGQLPHWSYIPCKVQWPFGYGLSYTTFQYSNLLVRRQSDKVDTDLDISVNVKNIGNMTGAETVLIFTFDEYRRTTPENKRLRAFHKVLLQPNQDITVNLTIFGDDLRFIGPHDDQHYITDPDMTYWVGVGSETDCRLNNIDAASDSMCVYMGVDDSTSQSNSPQHTDVCDTSCDIWINRSGCASHYGLTYDSCMNMCTTINEYPNAAASLVRDGWGWNYVNCIESVVIGFHHQPTTTNMQINDCLKMTTLCRDIFRTHQLDEYGIGPTTYHKSVTFPPLSSILALFAGLVSVCFIWYTFQRRTKNNRRRILLPNTNHRTTTGVEENENIFYQRLEDTDNERERQFIENTISLLGLD
jgi:beta-glucosidase